MTVALENLAWQMWGPGKELAQGMNLGRYQLPKQGKGKNCQIQTRRKQLKKGIESLK